MWLWLQLMPELASKPYWADAVAVSQRNQTPWREVHLKLDREWTMQASFRVAVRRPEFTLVQYSARPMVNTGSRSWSQPIDLSATAGFNSFPLRDVLSTATLPSGLHLTDRLSPSRPTQSKRNGISQDLTENAKSLQIFATLDDVSLFGSPRGGLNDLSSRWVRHSPTPITMPDPTDNGGSPGGVGGLPGLGSGNGGVGVIPAPEPTCAIFITLPLFLLRRKRRRALQNN